MDLTESYKILKDYGNMSSPTVLFVLKEILDNIPPNESSKKIFAAAFGPGLTVETMQLNVVPNLISNRKAQRLNNLVGREIPECV